MGKVQYHSRICCQIAAVRLAAIGALARGADLLNKMILR
eukprot:COSAG01_NODE_68185_length_264_cov_128.945455_1_plen_38_part_10